MVDRKRIEAFLAIPKKANKVLQIVSLLMLCIGFRLVYLTVFQHEKRKEIARSSLQKTVFEPALRGTIQDRFGITLARNEVEFQVGVVWSEIVHAVPRWTFTESESPSKKKIPLRKKYVQAFASMLGKELSLDAKRIEDLVYSYAVFSANMPVPLVRGISEKQFYRLQARVRFWPGLVVERMSKRVYPRGSSLCHVIGYTAPLGREEYESVLSEIHELRAFLKAKELGEERELPAGIASCAHAKERLARLERCGYSIFDTVGKMGIEASFEEQLRGVRGFKKYIMNSRGDALSTSSSSLSALSGKRILLTLSSELQEYAEKLLLETEGARKQWQKSTEDAGRAYPFFRGGAIVALDPRTSEVIALASTPRFDPNDCARSSFATHISNTPKPLPIPWVRNEYYAEALWNLSMPLIHEKILPPFSKRSVEREERILEWNLYLNLLCPTSHFLQNELDENKPVSSVLSFQKELFTLSQALKRDAKEVLERVYAGKEMLPPGSRIREVLEKVKNLKELFLFFDLSRLLLRQETLEPLLEKELGYVTLKEIRHLSSAQAYLLSLLEEKAYEEFQKGPFQVWREAHEKRFLLEKRKEEETLKKMGKPYLHYLDLECRRQFSGWWQEIRISLLQACAGIVPLEQLCGSLRRCLQEGLHRLLQEERVSLRKNCFLYLSRLRHFATEKLDESFIRALQTYRDVRVDLLGTYRIGGSRKPIQTGKELIAALFMLTPPPTISFAFSQATAPGSLFKLVTGYAALHQQASQNGGPASVTPKLFVFHDRVFRQGDRVYVGYDGNGEPLPQLYKGGRLPKSLNHHIGEIDLIGALAASSNPYFSLLAAEKLKDPDDLVKAARLFGFGEKTGMCLPFEAKGHVPNDVKNDKTNLYMTAIGQHTLLATPLQAAMMLSSLTTDGSLYVPKVVKMALGKDVKGRLSFSKTTQKKHMQSLQNIGIDFPLFLEYSSLDSPYRMFIPKQKCRRTIPLQPEIQTLLLKGMEGAIRRIRNTRQALSCDFRYNPSIMTAFLQNESMIGKSSTAESLETVGLALGSPPLIYNHTWFGAVFFDEKERGEKKPSLVVVVFLRYGKFGRQVAPLAAAIYEEWKRLQCLHEKGKGR